jgi:hypothetical protein
LQVANIQHHHLNDSFFLFPCLFLQNFGIGGKFYSSTKNPSSLSLVATYLSFTLMAFMFDMFIMTMMMCC